MLSGKRDALEIKILLFSFLEHQCLLQEIGAMQGFSYQLSHQGQAILSRDPLLNFQFLVVQQI